MTRNIFPSSTLEYSTLNKLPEMYLQEINGMKRTYGSMKQSLFKERSAYGINRIKNKL